MLLNILLYNIVGQMFPYCPKKISLLPKMTSPQLLLDLGELLENPTSRNTLHYTNYSGNRITGRKRDQYVNIFFRNLTLVYLKIKLTGNLIEKLFHSCTYIATKYLLPIFRTPNQMILSFIYSMACSFQTHTIYYGKSRLSSKRKICFRAFHLRPKVGAFKRIFRKFLTIKFDGLVKSQIDLTY